MNSRGVCDGELRDAGSKAPASEGGRYKGGRRLKAAPTRAIGFAIGRNFDVEFESAWDLLEFELAIEGFEDPGLESVAVAGLYFAEDEAEAGGAGVEDDGFGFEGFSGIANLEGHVALFFERGGGFEETALQAQFGHACGENRLGRAIGNDLGVSIEGKAQATDFSVHSSRLIDWKKRVERTEEQAERTGRTGLPDGCGEVWLEHC
jgi:hypothetical protein